MQFVQVKRREILRMIGGAAICWAVSAAAQQPKMPTIEVLLVESPGSGAAVKGGAAQAGSAGPRRFPLASIFSALS
jgi:hypothetical protein